MNVLSEIRRRFAMALREMTDDPAPLLEMVRRAQDPKFGDYQANCAMPLAKQLGRPPRDVAQEMVAALDLDDLCQTPEVAGPGFINLRLKDEALCAELQRAVADDRLGVAPAAEPETFVIDYSAPNVAKPMHVGHIRSTVIGDALKRILRFCGHRAIGDNHIGDWGTQFGMILYGYKQLRDEQAYRANPLDELARLYRLVNQLVEYHRLKPRLGELETTVSQAEEALQSASQEARDPEEQGADKAARKQAAKEQKRQEARLRESREELAAAREKVAAVENSPQLAPLAEAHPDIGRRVLDETAQLHVGDGENVRLWREFLPVCLESLNAIYERLGVEFDHTLGESFYHDRLGGVVEDLRRRGIAQESEGAFCVFLEGHDTPFLVQKQDGAFLYATSDLATIQYRMEEWSPAAILYVVDFRQGLHFEQLFATARRWGYTDVELRHIAFGTVLGPDGKPYRTRSGETIGLQGLLDEAVQRAYEVMGDKDATRQTDVEFTEEERRGIAEKVGIGSLKYFDLAHNRTSDYKFDYGDMLSLKGNTAVYMQYAYARTRGIFRKGNVDVEALRRSGASIQIGQSEERALALAILRLSETLEETLEDYRPNVLTEYLYEQLSRRFSDFFEACPVLKAETRDLRDSRLLLCDLTARTLKLGLELLGIEAVEKM